MVHNLFVKLRLKVDRLSRNRGINSILTVRLIIAQVSYFISCMNSLQVEPVDNFVDKTF